MIVLIVDDSKLIVERLVDMLMELPGIQKIFAGGNYREAQELLEKQAFDAAILDLSLPDGSGIDILRFLKYREKQIKKIIMITDELTPERAEVCRACGAHHVLNKFEEFEMIPELLADLQV